MKTLYIDLVSHKQGVTADAVILPTLEGSMLYARRTNHVVIMTKGITRKVYDYLTAYTLNGNSITLYTDKGVFTDGQALTHASEIIAEKIERFYDNELLQRTWKLILDNNIPLEVVRHIDDYIPLDKLSQYDIQLGQTIRPSVKRSTYKPTDLQRKEWGVNDKDFMFTKEKAQCRYDYVISLYDKLIAWLQLQYYTQNNIPPLYTPEETERAQAITPYSAMCDLNAYENACY